MLTLMHCPTAVSDSHCLSIFVLFVENQMDLPEAYMYVNVLCLLNLNGNLFSFQQMKMAKSSKFVFILFH